VAINPDPTATTARTIVTLALRDSGYLALGQSAPAQITNEAFIRLNWLLSLWNAKRWLTWHLVDVAAISVGQQFFTVGPSGDFDTNTDFNLDFNPDFGGQPAASAGGFRPGKVEKAYSRLLVSQPALPVDFPLKRISSYEDYSKIRLKTQGNFPTHYFYDPAMPQGRVFFWPIPLASQFEMHLLLRQPLSAFATLDTALFLPPEYAPALELNLALWLRRAAKFPPDPELALMAKDALSTIRMNNTEIPNLDMPVGLTRRRIYNIFADESH